MSHLFSFRIIHTKSSSKWDYLRKYKEKNIFKSLSVLSMYLFILKKVKMFKLGMQFNSLYPKSQMKKKCT